MMNSIDAAARNEPNGRACFMVARPDIMSAIPIAAPIQIPRMITKKPIGYPNTNPINAASFTSPKPIQRPLDAMYSIAKKPAISNAEMTSGPGFLRKKMSYSPNTIMAGMTNASGRII